jgi:hypothetical protein
MPAIKERQRCLRLRAVKGILQNSEGSGEQAEQVIRNNPGREVEVRQQTCVPDAPVFNLEIWTNQRKANSERARHPASDGDDAGGRRSSATTNTRPDRTREQDRREMGEHGGIER